MIGRKRKDPWSYDKGESNDIHSQATKKSWIKGLCIIVGIALAAKLAAPSWLKWLESRNPKTTQAPAPAKRSESRSENPAIGSGFYYGEYIIDLIQLGKATGNEKTGYTSRQGSEFCGYRFDRAEIIIEYAKATNMFYTKRVEPSQLLSEANVVMNSISSYFGNYVWKSSDDQINRFYKWEGNDIDVMMGIFLTDRNNCQISVKTYTK